MIRKKSEELFKESCKYITGGVNSPVRAFNSVGMSPVFFKSGKGAMITDADNNEYIDYICSWGPMILGHASEIALEGVVETLSFGTSFGAPTEIEKDVAKIICDSYKGLDLVRMVNSGTEATMSALRVARGYTGRDKILKFEGCYHGHSDCLLVKSGSGTLTFGVPTSPGVPAGTVADTLVATYNDIDGVKELFNKFKGEIAAVIVEPVAGNMGVVPPKKEFLQMLRDITKDEGTVLIFDEVITGFRLGFGSANEYFGIVPDMACFGKIIGGGLPVGAYGGRKDIMEMVSPIGPVYQAGTLSGNPVAMKMGLNVLTYLKNNENDVYSHIENMAIKLEKGMNENIKNTGTKATVTRVKGMVSMFFTEKTINGFDDVMTSDTDMYAKYFVQMLDEGILLPPAQFEGMFLSTAHSEEIIEKTLKIQEKVLYSLKNK